ncbi:MAG: hypothetical protein V5A34_03715 [Halapricum sp.]
MTSGDDPPDEDNGRVLAPDELDISDDEHVAEIDEGRYVVSPNDPIEDPPDVSQASTDDEPEPASDSEPPSDPVPESEPDEPDASESKSDPLRSTGSPDTGQIDLSDLTESDVSRWLKADFQDANSRYGFHVTATFDGRVFQRRMMSNDVVTIFESLILWYAQHIDSDTPVEEILGILLTETNVPITYPTESLSRAIKAEGLGPDDTIGELLECIGEDGFEL